MQCVTARSCMAGRDGSYDFQHHGQQLVRSALSNHATLLSLCNSSQTPIEDQMSIIAVTIACISYKQ